jgi:hypothetical protein
MPYHDDSDSDMSSVADEKVSQEETDYVLEAIKERAAGSSEVVIGVVHKENRNLLSEKIDKLPRRTLKCTHTPFHLPWLFSVTNMRSWGNHMHGRECPNSRRQSFHSQRARASIPMG